MADQNGRTEDQEEEAWPALRRVTLVDRLIHFAFGAVPTILVMLTISPLFEPMPVGLFLFATTLAAFVTGGAAAAWGDRFVTSLLRAIGRIT